MAFFHLLMDVWASFVAHGEVAFLTYIICRNLETPMWVISCQLSLSYVQKICNLLWRLTFCLHTRHCGPDTALGPTTKASSMKINSPALTSLDATMHLNRITVCGYVCSDDTLQCPCTTGVLQNRTVLYRTWSTERENYALIDPVSEKSPCNGHSVETITLRTWQHRTRTVKVWSQSASTSQCMEGTRGDMLLPRQPLRQFWATAWQMEEQAVSKHGAVEAKRIALLKEYWLSLLTCQRPLYVRWWMVGNRTDCDVDHHVSQYRTRSLSKARILKCWGGKWLAQHPPSSPKVITHSPEDRRPLTDEASIHVQALVPGGNAHWVKSALSFLVTARK